MFSLCAYLFELLSKIIISREEARVKKCEYVGENWGGFFRRKNQNLGGYYDPPFKCRVPNQEKNRLEARCINGLGGVNKSQQNANKLATKKQKLIKKLTYIFEVLGVNFSLHEKEGWKALKNPCVARVFSYLDTYRNNVIFYFRGLSIPKPLIQCVFQVQKKRLQFNKIKFII